MVDVTIVVAVISLVSSLAAAAFTGWLTYYSGERKRRVDAQKLVDKYSDPILLAAQDLQERLYNIIVDEPASKPTQMRTATPKAHFDSPIVLEIANPELQYPALPQDGPSTRSLSTPSNDKHRYSFDEHDATNPPLPPSRAIENNPKKGNLLVYTAFLVGQYFSWTSIMRRQAQFLKFSTSDKNKKLVEAFQKINEAFIAADGVFDPLSNPFSLPRSYQGAIGEMMTKDYYGDKPVCIGYASFYSLWTRGISGYSGFGSDDVTQHFHQFFLPIVEGIGTVYTARINRDESVPDRRLRRLQHLFADLVNLLDDKNKRYTPKYCHRDGPCKCEKCSKKKPCPCGNCPATNQGRVRQARQARRVRIQEV